MTALVAWKGVGKRYRPDARDVLHGIDLDIAAGDYISICGASGSGKTTLLNLLGLVDRPTTGVRSFEGTALEGLSRRGESRIRRRIAFVFQEFYLVDDLSTQENVALPLVYRQETSARRRTRAYQALADVGLPDAGDSSVLELSGGQRQRVALARALVAQPALLLCDEPTGSLDPISARLVLDILASAHAAGTTGVVVTHSVEVAQEARRRWIVEQGHLIETEAA